MVYSLKNRYQILSRKSDNWFSFLTPPTGASVFHSCLTTEQTALARINIPTFAPACRQTGSPRSLRLIIFCGFCPNWRECFPLVPHHKANSSCSYQYSNLCACLSADRSSAFLAVHNFLRLLRFCGGNAFCISSPLLVAWPTIPNWRECFPLVPHHRANSSCSYQYYNLCILRVLSGS